jgi:G-protein coupled receptor 98
MAIISPKSTARVNEDFQGSDVTLSFKPRERTKSLAISINSDNIPERDETIIVKLVNPTAGASVAQGTGNNVTIIIQANDVVAGYVGFSMLSQVAIVREGEIVYLKVVRTSPAAGMVNVDWLIQGQNVTKDFNETYGTVVFKEVWYEIICCMAGF